MSLGKSDRSGEQRLVPRGPSALFWLTQPELPPQVPGAAPALPHMGSAAPAAALRHVGLVPPGAALGWVGAGRDEAGRERDAPAHAVHSKPPSWDRRSLAGAARLQKKLL